jgi:hypothetical protein
MDYVVRLFVYGLNFYEVDYQLSWAVDLVKSVCMCLHIKIHKGNDKCADWKRAGTASAQSSMPPSLSLTVRWRRSQKNPSYVAPPRQCDNLWMNLLTWHTGHRHGHVLGLYVRLWHHAPNGCVMAWRVIQHYDGWEACGGLAFSLK